MSDSSLHLRPSPTAGQVPPTGHHCQVIVWDLVSFQEAVAPFTVIIQYCWGDWWTFHLYGHSFLQITALLHLAQPRVLLPAPGKIRREINILKVKTVFKGLALSCYKSIQQYSLQEILCRFRIWPENNSDHRIAAKRWKIVIRSSPSSPRAVPSGYTECFVLWSVKL